MRSEKQQELRIWRKENGLCTKCGRKMPEGYAFATCEKCRASSNAYRQFRKENGLCINCGNKLPDGYTAATCEDCKNYRNSYQRLLKKERLCAWCEKQDAYTLNKRTLCADCSEMANENQKKRIAQNAGLAERKRLHSKAIYNSRKERGLCARCGKNLPEGDCHVLCPGCRARYRRYNGRKADKLYGPDRLTRQNVSAFGVCSICFKAPAERGKLCESCYAKSLIALSAARETLRKNRANHPWVMAERARLEEVRRKHGWEKQPDKK